MPKLGKLMEQEDARKRSEVAARLTLGELMDQEELRQQFKAVLPYPNIMTRGVVLYGQSGPFIYEISSGEGMDRQPIYGVTIIRGTEHCRNLAELFQSYGEAKAYAYNLKNLSIKKEG